MIYNAGRLRRCVRGVGISLLHRVDGDAEEKFTGGRHRLWEVPRTLWFATEAYRSTLLTSVVIAYIDRFPFMKNFLGKL